MRNARIHFGISQDNLVKGLNGVANGQGLTLTAFDSRNGKPLDIKAGPFASEGAGTGFLLNGTYHSMESIGNYLAGLDSQTGTVFGKHVSPELAQKLFGAYQQGGMKAVVTTFVTGREFPGTSGPYWGEVPYSGYAQQEGINAATQK